MIPIAAFALGFGVALTLLSLFLGLIGEAVMAA